MSGRKVRRRIRLTDPRALRAVAHPTRMALIGLLRTEGPLTATRAGELLGESAASCSFHLRQLAKHGLVEEAPGGRGRQRPWRATARFTSWPEVADTPAMAAATGMLNRMVIERYCNRMMRWVARRDRDPRDWQEGSGFGDSILYLTPDELARIKAELEATAMSFSERTANRRLRPPGSRPVAVLYFAFPEDRPGRS